MKRIFLSLLAVMVFSLGFCGNLSLAKTISNQDGIISNTNINLMTTTDVRHYLRWLCGNYYDANGNWAVTISQSGNNIYIVDDTIQYCKSNGYVYEIANYTGSTNAGSCVCRISVPNGYGYRGGDTIIRHLTWRLSNFSEDGVADNASIWFLPNQELVRR